MQDSSFPPHVILLLPLRAISILHCIRASMISAPGAFIGRHAALCGRRSVPEPP
jgi:hypothetical protein